MLSFEWNDRPRLEGMLAEQGSAFEQIAAHARRWICDPSGFTTSPLCLLSPLAEALDEVAAGFGWLGAAVEESWSEVRRDTSRTLASYAEADTSAYDGMSRLTGRLS